MLFVPHKSPDHELCEPAPHPWWFVYKVQVLLMRKISPCFHIKSIVCIVVQPYFWSKSPFAEKQALLHLDYKTWERTGNGKHTSWESAGGKTKACLLTACGCEGGALWIGEGGEGGRNWGFGHRPSFGSITPHLSCLSTHSDLGQYRTIHQKDQLRSLGCSNQPNFTFLPLFYLTDVLKNQHLKLPFASNILFFLHCILFNQNRPPLSRDQGSVRILPARWINVHACLCSVHLIEDKLWSIRR